MPVSVDWSTKIINVPQDYLTSLGGSQYSLDINQMRLDLRELEASQAGVVFDVTHSHNAEVTVAGTTLSRVFEVINGYSITFEDGQYSVDLLGANSNIASVTNVNQVSLRSFNSAGLITVAGAGATAADIWGYNIAGTSAQNRLSSADNDTESIIDLLTNNANVTVETNGSRTITVYEDDGTTIRSQTNISADGNTRTRII